MKKYRLEVVVFCTGLVGMILELVGARVIAPYLGTTIVVWASLIGVILGSLSAGYWWGGWLSDKQPTLRQLSAIVVGAALLIGSIPYLALVIMPSIGNSGLDLRLRSLMVTLILFAPSTFLLGAVSPYAAKLKLQSLQTSGRTVGNLYALSTLGSITGTLSAGFWLIQYFSNDTILFSAGLLLLLIACLTSLAKMLPRLFLAFLLLGSISAFRDLQTANERRGFINLDSAYSKIWIFTDQETATGKAVREMRIGSEMSSGMYVNSDELVYAYTRYYRLAAYFKPDLKRGITLGGAAYSYPKDFLHQFPQASMEVVEIDPTVTALAKQYFRLPDSPRLQIVHQDARTFLNQTSEQYDVLFGDAFRSSAIPFQLTTQQAVQKMYDHLASDGVVLLNTISAISGDKGRFLQAEYATFKSVFPQVYIFPVQQPTRPDQVQNIMLVALKSQQLPTFHSENPELNSYLQHRWTWPIAQLPILTDQYAPVDRYTLGVQ